MSHRIAKIRTVSEESVSHPPAYDGVLSGMVELLEQARRASARVVNSIMTATYWELGRRIVEFEPGGNVRAGYGETLLERLAFDLTARFGRGFSRHNLARFRDFYRAFPPDEIRAMASLGTQPAALSGDPIRATPSLELPTRQRTLGANARTTDTVIPLAELARLFPLPWSHYILLIRRARSPDARSFYDTEARRNGWTVKQLERQIETQFYERTALSRNKAAMLSKGAALARYATEGLPTKMLVREYLTALPKASVLEAEIRKTRRQLEGRKNGRGKRRGWKVEG